ncbi:MAG: ATP-dependent DNA helicase [Thermofilaceae archaeon]
MDFKEIWPYKEWRLGQREIAEAVYKYFLEGKHLLISYPMGAGKTAAVLTGSLAAVIDEGLKLIYLVKTRSQFQAPLRELKMLNRRVAFSAVFLQNKRDLCLIKGASVLQYDDFLRFCSELSRNGLCPYFKCLSKVKMEGILSPGRLIRLASEAEACPYEVAKAALSQAEVIIAAYNYVFDPDIRKIFFSEVGVRTENITLVIDEAHNLPYTLIDVLSKNLSRKTVRKARQEVSRYYTGLNLAKLERDLYSFYAYMSKLEKIARKGCGEVELSISDLVDLIPSLDELARAAISIEVELERPSALRSIISFLSSISSSKHGFILTARIEDNDIILKNLCVSPAYKVRELFSNIRGSCLMSGTLPPRDYIIYTIGLEEEKTFELRMPPPWATRVKVLALRGVSSRFIERGFDTYEAMAKAIDGLFENLREGMALVVAPSYDMAKALRTHIKSHPILMEREDTSINDVVKSVKVNKKLILLCVAWGKLVEGIELRVNGRSLIKLVVIAGLPVPEPNILNKSLFEQLKYKVGGETAWYSVYLAPAAVKVAQAMGRSVRSRHDTAIIAMLDERVLDNYVKSFLTSLGYNIAAVENIEELIEVSKVLFGEMVN